MNIASIDIGSNTVLLLIAGIEKESKNITTILNKYEIPRIGKNLEKTGNISGEAIDNLINVLRSYDKIITEYDCEHVLVNATNAMRVAANSAEIVNMVMRKFGYTVNIIPGRHEAYLSYLGATYGKTESTKIVIDIGGGSTEIIIGHGEDVYFVESIGIGVVNLTEKHCSSLPPSGQEINNISAEVIDHLARLKIENKVENIRDIEMIAVAGTPTTLSCINQNLGEYNENLVEGSVLTLDELNSLSNELAKYSPHEVLEKYGEIVKGREDVLLTGTILLQTIADNFGTREIIVSGRGMRYGAIVDFLNSPD